MRTSAEPPSGAIPDARPHPELMDDPGLSRAEAWRALADLERVNRWLLGLLPARRTLLPWLTRGPSRQWLADVGCGSGQVAESLRSAMARRGRRLVVLGVDRKLSHLVFARRQGVEHLPVVADVESLPFPDGALDWTLSTLLLHHFGAAGGRRLLAEMARVCRRGAVIVDLRKSGLARLLIRVLLPLLGVGRVARHDGRASTAAAWSLSAVRRIAGEFEIQELRRRFPFRFSLRVGPPRR